MNRIRTLACAAVAAVCMIAAGCSSIRQATPYEQGYAAGVAAYLAYERVAEGKDEEFRDTAAKAWEKVEAIDSTEHLATDAADIAALLVDLENYDGLTDAEKTALRAACAVMLVKLDQAAADGISTRPEIVEFLVGARAGVDAFRPKEAVK